ncbi:MAG: DUF1801 domain-containing protein, partial [Bacteroidetes bacterium]|nr:DUF1801 domain-containing protein [Fibrella sp.]
TADGAVREKIAWSLPVYSYQQRHVCYLNVLRSERTPLAGSPAVAVDLAFMRGNELPDDAGWLESRDRKVIKSLVIRDISALDEDLIRTYIQEALLLSRVER